MVFTSGLASANFTENFTLVISDGKIEVQAPKDFVKDQKIIVRNQTLERIYGRIEINGEIFSSVMIESGSDRPIGLNLTTKPQSIMFIPLSPPGPSVPFLFGQPRYEIPQKI